MKTNITAGKITRFVLKIYLFHCFPNQFNNVQLQSNACSFRFNDFLFKFNAILSNSIECFNNSIQCFSFSIKCFFFSQFNSTFKIGWFPQFVASGTASLDQPSFVNCMWYELVLPDPPLETPAPYGNIPRLRHCMNACAIFRHVLAGSCRPVIKCDVCVLFVVMRCLSVDSNASFPQMPPCPAARGRVAWRATAPASRIQLNAHDKQETLIVALNFRLWD